MNERERTRRSKFLSFVLRHEPQAIGLELDAAGWVAVDLLLARMAANKRPLTRAELDEIVATSPKQRFAFDPERKRIRANQGHSVEVELGLQPMQPPELLYHGTTGAALPSIRERGLDKMQRHHVHLSRDRRTATAVGQRRGPAIILVVRAGELHRDGGLFYRSENQVWLTESVPPAYIDFPDQVPSARS
jgi:putative RNA 2'-phosphotransferase